MSITDSTTPAAAEPVDFPENQAAVDVLREAADRLDRDAADLRRTWKSAGLPSSDRMARRVAVDTALAEWLRDAADDIAYCLAESDHPDHVTVAYGVKVALAVLGGPA